MRKINRSTEAYFLFLSQTPSFRGKKKMILSVFKLILYFLLLFRDGVENFNHFQILGFINCSKTVKKASLAF